VDADVTDNPVESRYEIRVGGELAGFAMYRDEDGRRVFFHTEVDPRHEGEGLGSRLVATALGESRDRGTPVVPLCPFFASVIRRHPEWRDVLAPELRLRFEHA
jgi:predicted GNAT family acetyltransferase